MNPDKVALEKLWDENTPKLYGYLINTLKDRSLADDILQGTWVKAIEALPQYTNRGNFSAWLFSIAKNEMRMHWRKGGREVEYTPEVHDEIKHDEYHEDKIFVSQILENLPADDQEIIRLRYIADLSFGEIAKILGINQINIRVRMHRILKNVRASINIQNHE
jgi:RNA polymerase sigma-70 factor (ECF subfamily)